MTNTTDLKFFTNSSNDSLSSRLAKLMQDAQKFDVLVGYFYTSGFYLMHQHLQNVDKIRILIGLSTNQQTISLINEAKNSQIFANTNSQNKKDYQQALCTEITDSPDEKSTFIGAEKFIEFIKLGKLEIRVHPSKNIHAKVYIASFEQNDRDRGRVITGSSNFSQNGLLDQNEFNVELKDNSDYDFAKEKFNHLWQESTDVTAEYVETIQTKTWINNTITPYEIYLKFLYEYFKEDFADHKQELSDYPQNFMQLQYQQDAVNTALRIINNYGGVFLADVVGLGKTYMATMLAKRLIESGHKKIIIIAPPHLLDKNNKGSWHNAFEEFHFKAKQFACHSRGLLDNIIETEKNYDIVLIDESHYFRSESAENYQKITEICRGKKVILVSATPYNNRPKDLFAQIKLFQSETDSSLPHLKNLHNFFAKLEKNLKKLDRQKDDKEYLEISKKNAKEIREKILKHLMVRRTRSEITKLYHKDLAKQQISFPKVAQPEAIFYEFNENENEIFDKTLHAIKEQLTYIRYIPLSQYKNKPDGKTKTQQDNMQGFMRTLLFKRLESSIDAFKKTIGRFIASYENFIKAYQNGNVYVSKNSQKIFDLLEEGNEEKINKILNDGGAELYKSSEFNNELQQFLHQDLQILQQIQQWWGSINRDPKILAFQQKLANEKPFLSGKSIIFTESQETANYLCEQLTNHFRGRVMSFTGLDNHHKRKQVLQNFDAKCPETDQKDDFDLLITTDVLAEGVNLHRANVVVNYDIPWNPARLMQRVGRINRIDTTHKKIFTYNFFPSKQSNDVIGLEESAKSKIASFIALLGNDAKLLSDDEKVESHKLDGNLFYTQLMQNSENEAENDALQEIEYLTEIRQIATENPQLFNKIKNLPQKSYCARVCYDEVSKQHPDQLITFLKKGELQKFYLIDKEKHQTPQELDFLTTAKALKVDSQSTFDKPKTDFYESFFTFLTHNKNFFKQELMQNQEEVAKSVNSNPAVRLTNLLLSIKKQANITDDDNQYLSKLIDALKEKRIPAKICNSILTKNDTTILTNSAEILPLLKNNIANNLLQKHYSQHKQEQNHNIEVILSCYFIYN